MRIAVIGLRGIPRIQGGIESHCEHLFPRIAERGHEVIIFARRKFTNVQEPYSHSGCQVLPIWHPSSVRTEALIHSLYALWICRSIKPDIVHIHAIGPGLWTPIGRLLGYHIVVTHHGMDYRREKWGRIAKFILRTGEYLVAHFANAVISISTEISNRIRELSPNQKIAQIPNGVILPNLDKKELSDSFLQLGLQGSIYIFALGRFVPEKGFHNLITAWQKLTRKDVKLVIAGDSDHATEYSESLKSQAKETGVILTGFVRGALLDDLFRHASVFAIPSTHEGLPIALLEAMSYDLPLVVSDILPHKELALPDRCYYPVHSQDALLQRIIEQLDQPERFQNRSRLEKDFNWNQIAIRTEEVYQSILRGPKPSNSPFLARLQ